MNTGETLRAAAARVRLGWCQHTGFEGRRVCALGAIALSITKTRAEAVSLYYCGDSFAAHSLTKDIVAVLQRATGITDVALDWNDMPGQTAKNVAAGLEYAALIWDQEQAMGEPVSVGAVARAGEQVAVGPRA